VRIFSHEDRFWDDLQKKVHVILGTVFSNQSTLGAIILPAFSGTWPRVSGILWRFQRFSQILPRFLGIFPGISPGFSPNKNFWGALVPLHPAYYTTDRQRTKRFTPKTQKTARLFSLRHAWSTCYNDNILQHASSPNFISVHLSYRRANL